MMGGRTAINSSSFTSLASMRWSDGPPVATDQCIRDSRSGRIARAAKGVLQRHRPALGRSRADDSDAPRRLLLWHSS